MSNDLYKLNLELRYGLLEASNPKLLPVLGLIASISNLSLVSFPNVLTKILVSGLIVASSYFILGSYFSNVWLGFVMLPSICWDWYLFTLSKSSVVNSFTFLPDISATAAYWAALEVINLLNFVFWSNTFLLSIAS